MKECTTHHHACSCREEKFKKLEEENARLKEDNEDLLAVMRKADEMLKSLREYKWKYEELCK